MGGIMKAFFAVALVFLLSASPAHAMKFYDDSGRLLCDPDTHPNGCDSITGSESHLEIHLAKESGVYELPVTVNGAVTLNFILDTGASEVNIPADIASGLLRNGTISREDVLPGKIYKSADGASTMNSRVVIRQMDLGGVTVRMVPASIGPPFGLPLLGQSFLNKLPSWSLDNQKDVLIIGK